jgi:hypothetical protein
MPARPYRIEFPDATQDWLVRDRSWPTLERAILEAKHALNWVKKSDGSPANDAYVAVITNRETGYRWILRRGSMTVQFETPEMLAEQVAAEQLCVYLSVEEAEALAEAAESAHVEDKRRGALVGQATEQIRTLVNQVREARRQAIDNVGQYSRLNTEL